MAGYPAPLFGYSPTAEPYGSGYEQELLSQNPDLAYQRYMSYFDKGDPVRGYLERNQNRYQADWTNKATSDPTYSFLEYLRNEVGGQGAHDDYYKQSAEQRGETPTRYVGKVSWTGF